VIDILNSKLHLKLKTFRTSQEGAVTIDWVVLTALVVGLATAAFSGVDGAVAELTSRLVAYLNSLIV